MTSVKDQLRNEMRSHLAGLSVRAVEDYSRQLRALLTFPAGSRVALFAATRKEPALLDLIPQFPGVSWFLPKVTGPGEMNFIQTSSLAHLRPGSFGILEPDEGEEAASLDVIVCPGLAFTRQGVRLGQGGGFYDRALARFNETRKIGVAFPGQIRPELPREPHDALMDAVFTPTPEPPNETPEY